MMNVFSLVFTFESLGCEITNPSGCSYHTALFQMVLSTENMFLNKFSVGATNFENV